MNWIREIVIGGVLLAILIIIGVSRYVMPAPTTAPTAKTKLKPDCAESKLSMYTTKVNGKETYVPHRTDCVDSE